MMQAASQCRPAQAALLWLLLLFQVSGTRKELLQVYHEATGTRKFGKEVAAEAGRHHRKLAATEAAPPHQGPETEEQHTSSSGPPTSAAEVADAGSNILWRRDHSEEEARFAASRAASGALMQQVSTVINEAAQRAVAGASVMMMGLRRVTSDASLQYDVLLYALVGMACTTAVAFLCMRAAASSRPRETRTCRTSNGSLTSALSLPITSKRSGQRSSPGPSVRINEVVEDDAGGVSSLPVSSLAELKESLERQGRLRKKSSNHPDVSLGDEGAGSSEVAGHGVDVSGSASLAMSSVGSYVHLDYSWGAAPGEAMNVDNSDSFKPSSS